ncbi:MAG: hypothetical protein ACTSR5_08820, partial [Promethearchaeota archaeon]
VIKGGITKLILQLRSFSTGMLGKISFICFERNSSELFEGIHKIKKLEAVGKSGALELNLNPLRGSFQ